MVSRGGHFEAKRIGPSVSRRRQPDFRHSRRACALTRIWVRPRAALKSRGRFIAANCRGERRIICRVKATIDVQSTVSGAGWLTGSLDRQLRAGALAVLASCVSDHGQCSSLSVRARILALLASYSSCGQHVQFAQPMMLAHFIAQEMRLRLRARLFRGADVLDQSTRKRLPALAAPMPPTMLTSVAPP